MTRWSLQAVEKAAPDAASLAAARRLARPGPWSETGSTEVLVWGRCQGSGSTPYLVSIDLAGPAYRCSCPSRKFPCKHALALLLLWVQGDGSVADVAEGGDPAWAAAEARARRAAEAAGHAGAPTKAPDLQARARRLAERMALMDGGVEELALWLADLLRGGTVAARRRPATWWDAAGARLVDAQLPGLAERVRAAGSEVLRRPDWSEWLLAELGRWWLAVQAWRRRARLDARTLADLRVYVGWTHPTEEVRAADAVDDHWQVLGAHRSEAGRLTEQRTWLRCVGTGESVVLLDFAARGAVLPTARLHGTVLDATVARYPGSGPRRALLASEPVLVSTDAELPGGVMLSTAHDQLVAAWALNPWTPRVPAVLADVRLGDGLVVDPTGAQVPLLATEDPWQLAALTGGRPSTVFGELEDAGFRPLAVGEHAS